MRSREKQESWETEPAGASGWSPALFHLHWPQLSAPSWGAKLLSLLIPMCILKISFRQEMLGFVLFTIRSLSPRPFNYQLMSLGLVRVMEQCLGDNGHYKYFCKRNELPLEADMILTVSLVLFPALKGFLSHSLRWIQKLRLWTVSKSPSEMVGGH